MFLLINNVSLIFSLPFPLDKKKEKIVDFVSMQDQQQEVIKPFLPPEWNDRSPLQVLSEGKSVQVWSPQEIEEYYDKLPRSHGDRFKAKIGEIQTRFRDRTDKLHAYLGMAEIFFARTTVQEAGKEEVGNLEEISLHARALEQDGWRRVLTS